MPSFLGRGLLVVIGRQLVTGLEATRRSKVRVHASFVQICLTAALPIRVRTTAARALRVAATVFCMALDPREAYRRAKLGLPITDTPVDGEPDPIADNDEIWGPLLHPRPDARTTGTSRRQVMRPSPGLAPMLRAPGRRV